MSQPILSQPIDVELRMPPGIVLVPWPDGTVHIHCAPTQIIELRDTLIKTAQGLTARAISHKEQELQREKDRHQNPQNILRKIEQELAELKANT